MGPIRRSAYIFGLFNLLTGIAGFAGPLVTGNNDKIINIRPGYLFGFLGMNWVHALAHTLHGAMSLGMRSNERMSRIYMLGSGVLFGSLAAMGWAKYGNRPGLHQLMGMTINRNVNIVHTLWAVIGFSVGFLPMSNEERFLEAVEEGEAYLIR